MNADPLAEYYVHSPRYSSNLGGRTGIRGQIDALLNELRVPVALDEDGDWHLSNDTGSFYLIARDEDRKLLVRMNYNELKGSVKSNAELLLVLLGLNQHCEGACFAAHQSDQTGRYQVLIAGEKAYDRVDRDSLAELLAAAFKLSRVFDEVRGVQPPPAQQQQQPVQQQAPGGAWPAGWYDDPQRAARLRYWDGAAWTEHTAA